MRSSGPIFILSAKRENASLGCFEQTTYVGRVFQEATTSRGLWVELWTIDIDRRWTVGYLVVWKAQRHVIVQDQLKYKREVNSA